MFRFLKLIHRNIDLVEKKLNPPGVGGGVLTIKCKDFCVISLEISNSEELINVSSSLESLSSIGIIFLYSS